MSHTQSTPIRLTRRSVIAAALATTLAGCTSNKSQKNSGKNSSGSTTATGTVTYWDRSGFTLPAALVKKFNATHPNLHVKLTSVDTTSEPTKLATALRAGNAPDLVGIDDAEIAVFTTKGVMKDLTADLKGLPFYNNLSKGHLESLTYQGKLYGAPEFADLSGMYYNKTLFKKAGLNPDKPPTTFDEMLAAARKIRALGAKTYGFSFAGNCGGCMAFTALPHIWAAGTDLVTGPITNQKATVAGNSALKRTLELYHQMWTEKLVPPSAQSDSGTTWGNDFKQGNVGIEAQGYQFSTTLKSAKVKFDWGVAPIPGPSGGYSTFVGGADYAIPTTSKNPDGAWEFIKWALQKEQQALYPTYGLTPVRSDLLTDAYRKAHPVDAVFLKALKNGNLTLGASSNAIYHPLSGAWMVMLNTAIFHGDIAGAIQKGQQQFTQQIAQAGR